MQSDQQSKRCWIHKLIFVRPSLKMPFNGLVPQKYMGRISQAHRSYTEYLENCRFKKIPPLPHNSSTPHPDKISQNVIPLP